ncbi:hypothetical protein BsWGS_16641 [Bradybaena similaris]
MNTPSLQQNLLVTYLYLLLCQPVAVSTCCCINLLLCQPVAVSTCCCVNLLLYHVCIDLCEPDLFILLPWVSEVRYLRIRSHLASWVSKVKHMNPRSHFSELSE